MLKLTYWNPARAIRQVLRRDILIKHAEIDIDYFGNDLISAKEGAYMPVENYLIKLALATEISPRANVEIIPVENLQKAPKIINTESKITAGASQSAADAARTGWKRGAGYGSGSVNVNRQWSPDLLIKAQEQKDRQILLILAKLLTELKNHNNTDDSEWFTVLEGSCLVPFLEEMLKQANESWIELSRRHELIGLIFQICDVLTDSRNLFRLLCRLPHQTHSLAYYIEQLHDTVETGKQLAKKSVSQGVSKNASIVYTKNSNKATVETNNDEIHLENGELLQTLWDKITQKLSEHGENYLPNPNTTTNQTDFESLYKNKLKPLQFRPCSFSSLCTNLECDGCWRHNYWTSNKPKFSKEVMAIFKEWTALRSSLPISSSTSIFVCYDDENVHLLRALIIAPDDTPYANGCFLFDIKFPKTYPEVPPKVNLQTTGGNRVRFNPNLYKNGKVCLSLLGTWLGEQGERWNSRSSTVLQVLVSVQSLIFNEQPYFNEPGFEKSIGTEKGEEASQNYNKDVRKNCLNVAILGMLTSPPPDFEDIIKLHFVVKKDKVRQQLKQWLEIDKSIEKTVKSVNDVLNKLN